MKTSRLYNFVECNPSVKLKKGELYTLVTIDSIDCNRKYVTSNEFVEYVGQGCSKFSDGDTVMARITPCLENGKIAMYRGITDCVGSTELFVFRAIPSVSVKDFVYYFMKQTSVRNYAANSMTGASGRQRADIKFIQKMRCAFPCIDTQNKIASILSKYDELIENNNKRIKILEQMAENLYKEWFVRFRFPGHEQSEFENGIPTEWEKIRLGQRMSFIRGTSYSSADIQEGENVLLSMNNIKAYGGFIRDFSRLYGGKIKSKHVLRYGDLVMCITDMTQDRRIIGYVGLFDSNRTDCVISTHLMKIETKISHLFLLEFFNASGVSKLIAEFANGTNVLGLTESILCKIKTKLPPSRLIEAYGEKVHPIFDLIAFLKNQNDNLTKQRDMLLPRLMSGKLKVKV